MEKKLRLQNIVADKWIRFSKLYPHAVDIFCTEILKCCEFFKCVTNFHRIFLHCQCSQSEILSGYASNPRVTHTDVATDLSQISGTWTCMTERNQAILL